MNDFLEYNTQMPILNISEYGRSVQKMVDHICTVNNRETRNRMARTVVQIMINLNPLVKDMDNYQQKMWDHLVIVSEHKLDIDSPFPKPEEDIISRKPEPVPYKDTMIKFRFYGRNLQEMCEQASEMEDSKTKTAFINYIAYFMVNSSRNWNDENLTPEVVAEHIRTLSKGKLKIVPEELDIHIEHDYVRKNNNFKSNNNNKGGFKKKNKSRNRR